MKLLLQDEEISLFGENVDIHFIKQSNNFTYYYIVYSLYSLWKPSHYSTAHNKTIKKDYPVVLIFTCQWWGREYVVKHVGLQSIGTFPFFWEF